MTSPDVVVDTNVFVSSFFGGKPKKVMDLWKTGDITLCISGPIVDEYVNVLRRLRLQDEAEPDELLRLFAVGHQALFAAKTPKLRIVVDDPDDDKFIECAVALRADFIVSGDQVVTEIQNYMGIKIVNPSGFLHEINMT